MNQQITVERCDLEQLSVRYTGNLDFKKLLSNITYPDLLRALGEYIQFNSVFGSGAARLVSELGIRQEMFRNSNEPILALADESVEVAADIFAAIIDEFGGMNTSHRVTHRLLAKMTLKTLVSFLGYPIEKVNELLEPSQTTLTAVSEVRKGYLIDSMNYGSEHAPTEAVFNAIGFHIGSEILADQEFNILDSVLHQNFPVLVRQFEESKYEIGDRQYPSYAWIKIHTSVEADHADFALVSANKALKFYAGPEDKIKLKQFILDGFANFAKVQSDFMAGLLAEGEKS